MVRQEGLRESWYEEVLSEFVPLLLTALSMEGVALDHKYRIGCFFHILGKDPDFLGILENRVLPVLSEIRDSSAKLKVRHYCIQSYCTGTTAWSYQKSETPVNNPVNA